MHIENDGDKAISAHHLTVQKNAGTTLQCCNSNVSQLQCVTADSDIQDVKVINTIIIA